MPVCRHIKNGSFRRREIASSVNMGRIPDAVGSFGKLLICLPGTTHGSGNLLLSYDGKTKAFKTDTSSRWGYSYIAW